MFVFLFFLSDSRIVSYSPFAYKWKNRFWDNEPIVAHFSSNKGGTSNIRIPHSSSELHPALCMHDVCCVRGLGPSRTSKQNVLSLILLIPIAKFMNQKRGIYRYLNLYLLRLGPRSPIMPKLLLGLVPLNPTL